MKYCIDMLAVNDADCIILQYYPWLNSDQYLLAMVDAGNYSDGAIIMDFLAKYYPNHAIDIAIVTHPDKDHFGGFVYLLEQLADIDADETVTIRNFVINDPGNHVCADAVKRYRIDKNVQKEARSVYDLDGHGNLLQLIDDLKINRREAFAFSDSGLCCFANSLYVVGPTEQHFSNLVPDLRNNLEKANENVSDARIKLFASTKTPEQLLDEDYDDTSTHNASSLIVLFAPEGPEGNKFLFMGDATRESLENLPDKSWEAIKDCIWIKAPHHGSIHNLSTRIINHINPEIAFISASGKDKHPNDILVKVLRDAGVRVYSSHKGANICYRHDVPNRSGWSTAEPL